MHYFLNMRNEKKPAMTVGSHNKIGTSSGYKPMFVSSSTPYDFHLQSGSPAIDAGLTLSQVPYDFDGTARPQGSAYDIGAYEYVSGGGGSAPAVSFSPVSLTFGSQSVGTTSGVQYVTSTNTGNATLNLSASAISGDFAFAGLGTRGVGTPVPPGTSCTVSVQFTPTAAGPRTGTFTLTDDAPAGPTRSALLARE